MSEAETIRLARCMACDGDYLTVRKTERPGEYRQSICRHCQCGYMTSSQLASYTQQQTEQELLESLSDLSVSDLDIGTTCIDLGDLESLPALPALSESSEPGFEEIEPVSTLLEFVPYF